MSEDRAPYGVNAPPVRVETGPYRFGSDWPGVFIRGDHAGGYADLLNHISRLSPHHAAPLRPLIELLESSQIRGEKNG